MNPLAQTCLRSAPWRRHAFFETADWQHAQSNLEAPALPAETVVAPLHAIFRNAAHPLADDTVTVALRRRAEEIEAAFAAIEPALRALVPAQFEEGFAERASGDLLARLGVRIAPELLAAHWTSPINTPRLYARCVLGTFCRLIEDAFDRSILSLSDGEDAETLIRRWGFHAIDITPCADGRLSGVVDYILRVPPTVVAFRKSYAGAMFDVTESLRQWESVELRRWREATPNRAAEPTRYLKIGVYHFSSADPSREGCAAHGSDDALAAAALLERLQQFETAVAATHGEDARVATLLAGVDTDTDALRVHVPDAWGRMAVERYVDNQRMYNVTAHMAREEAKTAIREAVADCAGVAPDDAVTEGLRWFCGYVLKNNLAQVDAVRAWHGGQYADRGHTERLIVVGDAVDDVQLRNLAFQAQMDTVEEGVADLDVGIKILRQLHEPRGLAVPVLVHFRYDPRIPGDVERTRRRAERLSTAILRRYADVFASGFLHVQWLVRPAEITRPARGDLGETPSQTEIAA